MKKKVITMLSVIIIMILLNYYYISYMNNNKFSILDNKVQNSIGVNIHFINPNPNEMKQIYNAGFTTIRVDLIWSQIEK